MKAAGGRKEEMKRFGKILERMEESRLLKVVVEKVREGGIGWWEECEMLRSNLNWITSLGQWVD